MCWATLVVGVFVVVVTGAALSEQPENTCSGIGWGCELAGPDLALLILIFLGPVVLAVLVVGHAVIAGAHAIARGIERNERRLTESPAERAGR